MRFHRGMVVSVIIVVLLVIANTMLVGLPRQSKHLTVYAAGGDSDRGELFVLENESSHKVNLQWSAETLYIWNDLFAVSPDCSMVAFTAVLPQSKMDTHLLAVVDLETEEVIVEPTDGRGNLGVPMWPVFSPNSQFIAVTYITDDDLAHQERGIGIYGLMKSADGKRILSVPVSIRQIDPARYVYNLAWSRDTNHISFSVIDPFSAETRWTINPITGEDVDVSLNLPPKRVVADDLKQKYGAFASSVC